MDLLSRRGAVIFDMDGVLWHSAAAHWAAFRSVLAPLGVDGGRYADVAGMRTDAAMAMLCERAGRPQDATALAELVRAKRARARALLRADPPVAPDLHAVLDRLAGTHRLALASSASAGSVALFREVTGGAPWFDVVCNGDEVARAKPAPDIYALALERLAIGPDAAVVVEDAPTGVRAARAAGIAVIAVQGVASTETLREAGATVVIEGLADLIDDGRADNSAR